MGVKMVVRSGVLLATLHLLAQGCAPGPCEKRSDPIWSCDEDSDQQASFTVPGNPWPIAGSLPPSMGLANYGGVPSGVGVGLTVYLDHFTSDSECVRKHPTNNVCNLIDVGISWNGVGVSGQTVSISHGGPSQGSLVAYVNFGAVGLAEGGTGYAPGGPYQYLPDSGTLTINDWTDSYANVSFSITFIPNPDETASLKALGLFADSIRVEGRTGCTPTNYTYCISS